MARFGISWRDGSTIWRLVLSEKHGTLLGQVFSTILYTKLQILVLSRKIMVRFCLDMNTI